MSFDSMDFETLIDHVINKGDNNFINFLNVIKEVINISNKCIDELDNKLVEIDSDISDINYHAYNFLIRTNRIFISIIILLLFDRVEDAIILGRSFIENILQTIFMFNDKRGRSMRQIEIYNWLSLERYYEEIYKRSLTKFEERGLAKKPIKEFNNFEEIKKSIGQRLSKYPEREIERMRANFDNGKPWFGKRRRWGLKTYNLDSFLGGYNFLCQYSHCMETPYSDDQVSNVKYTVLYAIGQEFINHIEEFRYLCPKSLPTEKVESFYEIKMNLFISYYALIYKEDMTFEIIYNIKHPDFIKNLVNSTYLFSRSNKSLYDTVLEILEAIFGKDDKRMINFKKTLKEETDRYKE